MPADVDASRHKCTSLVNFLRFLLDNAVMRRLPHAVGLIPERMFMLGAAEDLELSLHESNIQPQLSCASCAKYRAQSIICRILKFMWSFGPLKKAVSREARRSTPDPNWCRARSSRLSLEGSWALYSSMGAVLRRVLKKTAQQ